MLQTRHHATSTVLQATAFQELDNDTLDALQVSFSGNEGDVLSPEKAVNEEANLGEALAADLPMALAAAEEWEVQKTHDQPITEGGFSFIQNQCCLYTLDLYSRRVLGEMNYEICDEGCFNGFFIWFHCNFTLSLDEYRSNILENSAEKCGCFAALGECGAGLGPGGRDECATNGPAIPYYPSGHRRRRCGSLPPSPPPPPGPTTTAVPSSERVCALPAAVLQYSLITLENAVLSAHTIYKGVAIGGLLTDGTPNSDTDITGPSIVKTLGTGAQSARIRFAGGVSNGDVSSIFDWSQFMWIAQNVHWLSRDGYNVRVFKHGGTFSSAGSDWGLNWEGQGEDNGKTLMVFQTNEDIRLVGTGNGRQFGPSVLAPFSHVTLDGSAGFADGFIIARQFGPSGTFPSVGNAGQLQLHGDGYTGPLACVEYD